MLVSIQGMVPVLYAIKSPEYFFKALYKGFFKKPYTKVFLKPYTKVFFLLEPCLMID